MPLKQRSKARRSARKQTVPRSLRSNGDEIVKRFSLPYSTIAATAGGLIALNTAIDTTLVQTAPATEWASFAARYQQFRVRAIHAHMMPCTNVSFLSGNTFLLTTMYFADFIGTSVPTSPAQVLSDERCRIASIGDKVVMTSTWLRNPNAKLWAPTSAAVPAANSYGIAFASATNSGILTANADYYTITVLFDVELRGSQ